MSVCEPNRILGLIFLGHKKSPGLCRGSSLLSWRDKPYQIRTSVLRDHRVFTHRALTHRAKAIVEPQGEHINILTDVEVVPCIDPYEVGVTPSVVVVAEPS